MKFLTPIFLIVLFVAGVFGQHCAYDGSEMLVVELVDHKGELILGAAMDLTLAEVGNSGSDACKYSPGLVKRGFRSPLEAFLSRYSWQASDVFREECADCTFNKDGFYAVILGQAESACMYEDEKGVLAAKARTYEVRYSRDGIEQSVKVARKDFFSLCTDGGKWSRFKPVRMQIKARSS